MLRGMKLLLFFAGCAGLLAGTAQAGWVIVQKVERGEESGTITIMLDEGWARMDLAEQVSKITNLKTGDEVTLMHERRQAMAIPAATARALAERVLAGQPEKAAPAEPAQLQASGRKEKVAGHPAEMFTWESGAVWAQYWFAADYPHAAEILALMQALQERGISAIAEGMLPAPRDFPGMPVKTVVKAGGETITMTIVSVEEKPVPPADFQIPSGYEKLPEPAIAPAR